MLASATWRALGSGVELLVNNGAIEPAREAVDRVLEAVDRTYSRFRPDSELSAVNAGDGRPTVVSALLARAIMAALLAAQQTNGLVDPTVGRAMRLIGYDDDFSRIAGRADRRSAALRGRPGLAGVVEPGRAPAGCTCPAASSSTSAPPARPSRPTWRPAAALAARDAGAGRGAGQPRRRHRDGRRGRRAGGWRILVAEDSATPAERRGR